MKFVSVGTIKGLKFDDRTRPPLLRDAFAYSIRFRHFGDGESDATADDG